MARKTKNLASFDELANNNMNINNDINNNINNNINVNGNANDNNKESDNINNNVDDNINNKDYLDKLLEGTGKKKESETVLTGIYLQKDLSQILDRLAKKGGRGAKSKIVNEALRSVFVEKGLL